MKAKLHSKRGSYEVRVDGENGEWVTIWLSYLPNSAALVIRLTDGSAGDGSISLEDYTKNGTVNGYTKNGTVNG